ncbi:diguanylate cyclase [Alteromonas sp. A081]|uniref:diguanylate cyclase n=1 Tax=Alteromonas sp. A081 TaxID=3410269 RepID=UPI003B987149
MVSQQNKLKGICAFLTIAIYCIFGVTSWYASAQANSINSGSHFNIQTKSSANSKLLFVSPSDDHRSLVNNKLFLSQPDNTITNAQQALAAFNEDKFIKNTANKVSFGFTDEILWAVLPIQTDTTKDGGLSAVIEIDNAWLDVVDIFFIYGDEIVRQESLGDTEAISGRTYNARMPSVSHVFASGNTYVLFRFISQDPMTIPIYLSSESATKSVMLENAYFYGFLYGALLILLVYNLVLYTYLKERRYLLYSCYLLAFTAFNFTYTGHGYWWLWGEMPSVQQWLMPTLMLCYIIAGVTFTIEFLNVKKYLPSLFVKRKFIYAGLLGLAVVMLVYGSQQFAIMVQLVILTTLSLWMLLIGVMCYKNGNVLATFFVPAIVLGTGGATVSSLATWGIVPYSQWAFRGIELGMLLEMSLLSVSLGFNFKEVYKARLSAEFTSRIDPLTNLYNRRAFTQLVYPIWELGVRKKQFMSIVIIDLDWFKQINDQFGHDIGDAALELVAKTIKARVRSSDLVFRWGGEEFLLFLPDTNVNDANALAETLRSSVEKVTSESITKVTTSIGVAAFNFQEPGDNKIEGLIKLADKALYLAKQKGRNCVVVG